MGLNTLRRAHAALPVTAVQNEYSMHRAVESKGNIIKFMLSAKPDISAAKKFFRKVMRSDHRRLPFSMLVQMLGG
jgi:transposase-like protein